MDTNEFDKAVVSAVFAAAGLVGWRETSLVAAAQDAGLDLVRLRVRFPGKTAVLLRFGVLADQAALAAMQPGGTPRERLFDLVMARFDFLQTHRLGVLAVIEALRTDPGTALMLWGATLRSMRWLLAAAAIPTGGITGALRIQGAGALWAYTLRAWEKDDSPDMSATMAALDRALDRAIQAEEMLPGGRKPADPEPAPPPAVALSSPTGEGPPDSGFDPAVI
jgi:hypothetical protein